MLNQATGMQDMLTPEGTPRQSQGLGPELPGRMGDRDDVAYCQHECIELRVGYNEWRSNLQHHEVISANLRQESEVAKQTHHYDLTEHRRVHGSEGLIGNSQMKLARGLK